MKTSCKIVLALLLGLFAANANATAPVTYAIGNASVAQASGSTIGALWMRAQAPFAPVNPSGFSGMTWKFGIDNGGSCDQNLHGNRNSMQFLVELVNQSPWTNSYYVASVNGWTTDGNNNCTWHNYYISMVASQRDFITVSWERSTVDIQLQDSLGNPKTGCRDAFGHSISCDFSWGWYFGAGTQPSIVYSPEADFSSDPNKANRCTDLGYPDEAFNGMPEGLLLLSAYYGAVNPTTEVPFSAPLTAPICSLSVDNDPSNSYVTWTPQ